MMFMISETEDYKVQGELAAGKFALHLRVYHWSASVYKELLNVLVEIFEDLRDVGCTEVYTGAPVSDQKALKCQQMFGFEYLTEIDGNTVMVQRI